MTATDDHDDHEARSTRMTNAEFAAALERLVSRARRDGVDLEGGYNVRTPEREQPDVTVEISRIAKRTDGYGFDPVE